MTPLDGPSVLDAFQTFSFGLLRHGVGEVKQAIAALARPGFDMSVVDEPCSWDIRHVLLSRHGPGRHYSARTKACMLFPSEKQGHAVTLLVSSLSDGHPTLLNVLSSALSGKILQFRFSRMDMAEPGNFLTCFQGGKRTRTVYSMKEERWVFFQEGNALEFENSVFYTRPRRPDRLNPVILAEYAQSVAGIPMAASFWIRPDVPAWVMGERDFELWRETA